MRYLVLEQYFLTFLIVKHVTENLTPSPKEMYIHTKFCITHKRFKGSPYPVKSP